MLPLEMERPTIKIFVSAGHGREKALAELCYGIEEEAIPFEVTETAASGAVALAWEAGRASRLEVGVGLDSELLVLHFGKLKQDAPLFSIPARSPEQDLRALGANAARLVKKLPFKPLIK